jgi:hypothetical protein
MWTKNIVGPYFGRHFSQTHLVTLVAGDDDEEEGDDDDDDDDGEGGAVSGTGKKKSEKKVDMVQEIETKLTEQQARQADVFCGAET